MLPKNRPPTPPGEILAEEFLKPAGMTQGRLAAKMGVPIQRLNLVINGRRAISPETAVLLARALRTTPEFWMNLQTAHDLWHAERRLAKAG
jgi:addiction module HigA family antidote